MHLFFKKSIYKLTENKFDVLIIKCTQKKYYMYSFFKYKHNILVF